MQATGKPSHEEVMLRLFLLKGVELFRDVPADQLLPLAHVARRVSFGSGELIFEEGDPGDELFVVADGAVAIEKAGVTLATLRQRAPFGEMAILDGSPRSASVRSVGASTAFEFARLGFIGLLAEGNLAAYKLVHQMAMVLVARQRSTTQRLVELYDVPEGVGQTVKPIIDVSTVAE